MWRDGILSPGSTWSLTPEEEPRISSVRSNFSIEGFSVDKNAGGFPTDQNAEELGPATFSPTFGQSTPDDEDSKWTLSLSESPQKFLRDGYPDLASSEEGSSNSSLNLSPPDGTNFNDYSFENSQDRSQEPSSLESRTSESSSGDEYRFRCQDKNSQNEFNSEVDMNGEEYIVNSADYDRRLSAEEFVRHTDHENDRRGAYVLSMNSSMESEHGDLQDSSPGNMGISSNDRNEGTSDLPDSSPRKRQPPEDFFENFELGSSDEMPESESLDIKIRNLGEELFAGRGPRPKKKRFTPERLREINEAWDEFYPNPHPDGRSCIESVDGGALSVRLALGAYFQDAEHIVTKRIPRALRILKDQEKLRDFYKSLGKDLTAMYTFVEDKALALIRHLQESCERLDRMDKMAIPTAMLESTIKELVAAVNTSASSVERLRSNREHFVIAQSFLESQLKLYLEVSEEVEAQRARNEAELAEIERSCADLEQAIDDATRQKDSANSEILRSIEAVHQARDTLQRELEAVKDQIQEKQRILSIPDSLKVEKLMTALREATAELLAARGMSPGFVAVESKPEESTEPLDFQESLKKLKELLESRKSVSVQTTITSRHVRELHHLIKITHDSQVPSTQEASQETTGQSLNETQSSVFC